MPFALTRKQNEGNKLLAGSATHNLLYGGSRSGKTFLWLRAIVTRALKAPKSRHAVLRFRNNAVKASIVLDTFPKVMELCFPGIHYRTNMTDLYTTFDNRSEVWFGGLDDKERVEKILGNEYVTIALCECSQIPLASRDTALTRLAQKCYQEVNGKREELPLKFYYDENPPDKGHWTYKMFLQKMSMENVPLKNPEDYVSMQMNPRDNLDNLPPTYIASLSTLSARMQKRFLDGEFREANINALFDDVTIGKWRQVDGQELPDMVRIIVALDPSGSDGEDNVENDEIGLMVGGLGTDGNGYLLEDLSIKAGPKVWGKMAVNAFQRHAGDLIIGETNFGGEMVKFVVQTALEDVPFKKITASRGKVIRAEPISPLVAQGKIRHVGYFPELEEELYSFTTNGYTGERSPNRADAWVFLWTELFPGLIAEIKKTKPPRQHFYSGAHSGAWMGS